MQSCTKNSPSNKGKFLWMEPSARQQYIHHLKKMIADGHFFSDTILSKITDDLAPVFEEVTLGDY